MVVCGSLVQLGLQEEPVAVMARQSAEQPPVANLVLIKLMPALPWETFVKQHVNLSPGLSNSSSTFNFIRVKEKASWAVGLVEICPKTIKIKI